MPTVQMTTEQTAFARECVTTTLNAMAPLTIGEIVANCPDFADNRKGLLFVINNMIIEGDIVLYDDDDSEASYEMKPVS